MGAWWQVRYRLTYVTSLCCAHGSPTSDFKWHGLVALVGLVPFGLRQEEPLTSALSLRPLLLVPLSLLAVALWLFAGLPRRGGKCTFRDALIAMVVATTCVLARRLVPPQLGLALIVSLPILAVAAGTRGRITLAYGLGFGGYALVARDVELLAVVSAAHMVEWLGYLVSRRRALADSPPTAQPWTLAALATTVFAAAFLCRVGLQRGMDFTSMDWSAGSFHDPLATGTRIALCLLWKYIAAYLLIGGATLAPLPSPWRRSLVALLSVLLVTRCATLAWMLGACRSSYPTYFGVLGDLPSMLLAGLVAAACLLVGRWLPQTDPHGVTPVVQ